MLVGQEGCCMRSIPVVVPGIMGSTLASGYDSGISLWDEDFQLNYRTLIQSPGLLRWTGNRAIAKVLNKVRFSAPYLPLKLTKFELWTRTLTWIKSHPKLDGEMVVEYGYDWRAPLIETALTLCSELSKRVGCDVSEPRPADSQAFSFFMHSMGGLVVQLAIGDEQLHPSWIRSLCFIGTPFRGSPAAFRSVYGSLGLPLFQDIFAALKGRNRAAFFDHLLECIQTFPSIYSLFPPADVLYLYYSSDFRSNPLLEKCMRPDLWAIATDTHSLLKSAAGIIFSNSIPAYAIYTAIHSNRATDLEYRVTPRPHQFDYEIHETVASTIHGDGTVPAESAKGSDPPIKQMSVIHVQHDTMCNSSRVVDCLEALFIRVTDETTVKPI